MNRIIGKLLLAVVLCLGVLISSGVVFADAPTVTLLAPGNNTIDDDGNVTFKFKVEWDTSKTLVCELHTNKSGTFQKEKDIDTSNVQSTPATVETNLDNIPDNTDLLWNVMCKYQNDQDEGWGANNWTVKIRINDAPVWQQSISDQTVDEDSGTTTVGDVDSYVTDPDGDSLTFSIADENTSQVDCAIDSNGKNLRITPAKDFSGTATCTVRASDGKLYADEQFTITVNAKQDAPSWKDISKQELLPNSTKTLDLSQYASDVDGDSLTFSIVSQPNSNIADCTLSGSSLTISTQGKSYAGETSCVVQVDDGHGNKVNKTIEINSGKLKFEYLKIETSEGSEKDLEEKESGYELDKTAEPNSTIKVELKVKNFFDDSTDIDIDDITATLTLEEMGDEDEQEEEVDFGCLDPEEKSDKETITFEVPLFVDEDTYELRIELEGTDDNGVKHELERVFKIKVDKKNHDLRIIDAAVYPSKLIGDGTLRFDVDVANIGTSKEKDVKVRVICNGLGISLEKEIDELVSDWDDEDNSWEGTFYADVENATAGTYTVSVFVYRKNGDKMDEKTLTVTIEQQTMQEGTSAADQQEETEVEVQTISSEKSTSESEVESTSSGATGVVTTTIERSFKESSTYKALLIGGIVVVCILILAILSFGFKRA